MTKLKINQHITKEDLLNAHFHKDELNGLYEYRKEVTLDVELVVRVWLANDEDSNVYYNTIFVKKGTNEIYPAYYNDTHKNNKIVEEIKVNTDKAYDYLIRKGIFRKITKEKIR